MSQSGLGAVVGRPLSFRRINRRERRLQQLLLSRRQLLLQLLELVLQTGNLLMAIPQLLEGIHQRAGIDGSKRAISVAPTAGQGVAVGLEVSPVQALQPLEPLFAVGLFPAIGEPLTELLLIKLQFLADSLLTISWQQRLEQSWQLLDELLAIQAMVEPPITAEPVLLGPQMTVTLQLVP